MGSILLDTNVLSELMRPAPDQPDQLVLDWFERQTDCGFFVSAITRAEVLLGIALLPAGRRRDRLAEAAEFLFTEELADRCLSFDSKAASEYALLVARRTRGGRPITTEDGQIAAVALAHGMPLATRNSRDFEAIDGLMLLDPWQTN